MYELWRSNGAATNKNTHGVQASAVWRKQGVKSGSVVCHVRAGSCKMYIIYILFILLYIYDAVLNCYCIHLKYS